MPIDLKRAEDMLKFEEDCPFTREQLEACKLDTSKPLFIWAGIDMYLTLKLDARKK